MYAKFKNFSYSKPAKVISFTLACILVIGATMCVCNTYRLKYENWSIVKDAVSVGKNYDLAETCTFEQEYIENVKCIMLQALYFKDGSDKVIEKSCQKEIENKVNEKIELLKKTDYYSSVDSEFITEEKYIGEGYSEYDENGHEHIYDNKGNKVTKSADADGVYLHYSGSIYQFIINEEKVRESMTKSCYATFKKRKQSNDKSLEKIKNLKYAVINKTDNNIYTNIDGINSKSTSEDIKKAISAYEWNLSVDSSGNQNLSDKIENYVADGYKNINFLYRTDSVFYDTYYFDSTSIEAIAVIETGIDGYLNEETGYTKVSPTGDEFEVYIGFENGFDLPETDAYSVMRSDIDNTRQQLKTYLINFSVCVLFVIACTAHLVVTAGRKEKKGEVKLAEVDKISRFIHFAFFVCLEICAGALFVWILYDFNGINSGSLRDGFLDFAATMTIAVGYAVFVEWVMSFTRLKRKKTVVSNKFLTNIFKKTKENKEDIT